MEDGWGGTEGLPARYVMARIRVPPGEVEHGERELQELRVEAEAVLRPTEPVRAQLGLGGVVSPPSR